MKNLLAIFLQNSLLYAVVLTFTVYTTHILTDFSNPLNSIRYLLFSAIICTIITVFFYWFFSVKQHYTLFLTVCIILAGGLLFYVIDFGIHMISPEFGESLYFSLELHSISRQRRLNTTLHPIGYQNIYLISCGILLAIVLGGILKALILFLRNKPHTV
jgi:hypothetical protein